MLSPLSFQFQVEVEGYENINVDNIFFLTLFFYAFTFYQNPAFVILMMLFLLPFYYLLVKEIANIGSTHIKIKLL